MNDNVSGKKRREVGVSRKRCHSRAQGARGCACTRLSIQGKCVSQKQTQNTSAISRHDTSLNFHLHAEVCVCVGACVDVYVRACGCNLTVYAVKLELIKGSVKQSVITKHK